MDSLKENEPVPSEVRLVEDIDRCMGRMPRNLQVLLSSLDNPDINDFTVVLLYTLMIETGFVPMNAQNVEEDVQNCCGFDAKKLGTYSKMPDGWKKECGKSYEMSFRIAPFFDHKCRFLVLSMLDLLVVDLFIEKHLDFDESPYVSCFTVCPANHVTISSSLEDEKCVEFNDVMELSRQFKDTIASPARATILNSCGVTNPSLLGLPEEVTLKLLTYLEVRDICNVSQTCKFLNGVSKDQHLWFNLVNRNWKLSQSWSNDIDWYSLYERKEIERRKKEGVTRTGLGVDFQFGAQSNSRLHRSIMLPDFNTQPLRHYFVPQLRRCECEMNHLDLECIWTGALGMFDDHPVPCSTLY